MLIAQPTMKMRDSMRPGNRLHSIAWLVLALCLVTGCAGDFILYHSVTGDPLLIARRAYTADGCTAKVKEDAVRMGVSLRYVHVRGSLVGRSLLWPFERGYACDAAIGSPQIPTGYYPLEISLLPPSS
jgi:hypothetical protein